MVYVEYATHNADLYDPPGIPYIEVFAFHSAPACQMMGVRMPRYDDPFDPYGSDRHLWPVRSSIDLAAMGGSLYPSSGIDAAYAATSEIERIQRGFLEPTFAAQRAMASVLEPASEMQRLLDQQNREITALKEAAFGRTFKAEEYLAQGRSVIDEVDRISRLSGSLSIADRFSLTTFPDGIDSALAEYRDRTSMLAGGLTKSSSIAAIREVYGSTETTRLKLAALAGSRDLYGYDSPFASRAFDGLLGGWATNPALPDRFWNDAEYRRDAYRDADVDEGLIEATPEVALDLVVDSGFAVGRRGGQGTIVEFRYSGVVALLSTTNLPADVHEAIRQFEKRMRSIVGRRMEARFGIEWMKDPACAPGKIFANAKEARYKAYREGEPRSPLIDFTHLGELKEVVKRNGVWDEAFADVFRNRDTFCRDMDRLIAARNPDAHSRDIDGPRFVEIISTIEKLSEQIEDDGQWVIDAKLDY